MAKSTQVNNYFVSVWLFQLWLQYQLMKFENASYSPTMALFPYRLQVQHYLFKV